MTQLHLACCQCLRSVHVEPIDGAIHTCECGRQIRVRQRWYTVPVYEVQKPVIECKDSAPLDYGKVLREE